MRFCKGQKQKMVGGGGIEPPTSSSSTTRSPTELTAHLWAREIIAHFFRCATHQHFNIVPIEFRDGKVGRGFIPRRPFPIGNGILSAKSLASTVKNYALLPPFVITKGLPQNPKVFTLTTGQSAQCPNTRKQQLTRQPNRPKRRGCGCKRSSWR